MWTAGIPLDLTVMTSICKSKELHLKAFLQQPTWGRVSQTALVADAANRINLGMLACIKTNKLLASGSIGLDHPNTQLWVFPLRLAYNNNNINNHETPVDIEELPLSSGSLYLITQLQVEQHRWVEFSLAFAKQCQRQFWLPIGVGWGGGSLFSAVVVLQASSHSHKHAQTTPNM